MKDQKQDNCIILNTFRPCASHLNPFPPRIGNFGGPIYFVDQYIDTRLKIQNIYTQIKYYIYHGSYELTYLNQRIRRMSLFK